MIYVVEVDGRPAQLRTSRSVAAYADRARAESAARSLRGRVVEYSVGRTPDAEEDAWREAERMRAERDQARAELEDQWAGNRALRSQYGARDEETMHMWIARLARSDRDLKELLAMVERHAARDGRRES